MRSRDGRPRWHWRMEGEFGLAKMSDTAEGVKSTSYEAIIWSFVDSGTLLILSNEVKRFLVLVARSCLFQNPIICELRRIRRAIGPI